MRYLSSRDKGYRIGNSASRTTVQEHDDTKVIAEHSLNGYQDESHAGIETFSNYGFTSVVKKPTGQGSQAQTAEAVTVYLGSNRSHGVNVAHGDRRYRLYKLAEGEIGIHDDQGIQVHFQRDGIWSSAPNSKKIVHQIMDDDTMPQDPDAQPVNGQKLGQIKQAGRPAAINMTLTKDSWTINHPKDIVFNVGTFTVNATGNIKLISAADTLIKGAAAILYATGSAFIKAAASINAKSAANLADPSWTNGASDPPISS